MTTKTKAKAVEFGQAIANVEAEKAILGAILLDNVAYAEACSLLEPADFHVDAHRKLFTRMIEVLEGGASIDIVTLTESLIQHKELEAIGGASYISTLTEGLPRRPSIANYCKIVRDKARRRSLILACESILGAAQEVTESTPELQSILEDRLLELRGNDSGDALHSIAEVMPEVVEQLQAEADGRTPRGFGYGLAEIDNAAGLMRPGELIVIGALPGRGKTALAAQILAENAGEHNVPTLDVTLEMTRWQKGRRLIAGTSTIGASRIREPRSIREGWPVVLEAAQRMSQWPVWFDDSSTITLNELRSRARLAIRRHKVKLIIVDYLRLVKGKGRDLKEKVGNVCDGLRQLAKEESVVVVLLSQLSRPDGGDINDRPSMIKLKESGDIEAHAHVIILLFTPVDEKGNPTGEDELIVAKCREGSIGSVPVWLHKQRVQFVAREVVR